MQLLRTFAHRARNAFWGKPWWILPFCLALVLVLTAQDC